MKLELSKSWCMAAAKREEEETLRDTVDPVCPYVRLDAVGCKIGQCNGRRCGFGFRVPHPYID